MAGLTVHYAAPARVQAGHVPDARPGVYAGHPRGPAHVARKP
jgi:hypothetical protein